MRPPRRSRARTASQSPAARGGSHRSDMYGASATTAAVSRLALVPARPPRARRRRLRRRRRRGGRARRVVARARLHAERGPRADLRGRARRPRPRARHPPADPQARRGPGLAQARGQRQGRPRRARHPRPRDRARSRAPTSSAIGALVGRPLAALIAQPDDRAPARPRGPHGRRLRAAVRPGVRARDRRPRRRRPRPRQAGHDRLQRGRPRCSAERVDAVPAFWNAEGVALKQRGLPRARVPRRRLRRAAVPGGRADHLAQDARASAATGSSARWRRSSDGRATTRSRIPTRPRSEIAEGRRDRRRRARRARSSTRSRRCSRRGLRLDRAVLERWADFDARIGIVTAPPGRRRGVRLLAGAARPRASASSGTSASASRCGSTGVPARISSAIASATPQTLTFIPATTRSPRSQNATNSRVAGSPRKTTRSPAARRRRTPFRRRTGRRRSTGRGRGPPAVRASRAPRPGPGGARWPSARRAGAARARVAHRGDVARGVDAGVAGREVLVDVDAVADLEPASAASAIRGATPTPTTTTSPSTVRPSSSRTRSTRPSPSNAVTPVPRRRSTPWSACRSR